MLYADFDTKLSVLLKYYTHYSIHGVHINMTRREGQVTDL
jgi:hypothetical protein